MINPGGLRRATGIPIYPFLAATYPVVFLYAQNVHEAIAFADVLVALAASLGGSVACFGVLRAITRRSAPAAVMTTWLVALFFTYGPAYTGFTEAIGAEGLPHVMTLTAWTVLAAIGILVITVIGDRTRALTVPFNAIGSILLVINLATIGAFALNLRSDPVEAGNPLTSMQPTAKSATPDIYWIILDRYGSGSVLDEFYGDDNTEFLQELEARGFYIAKDATANYLKTGLSMVSSRNMEYLDGAALTERATAPDDWGPIYRDLAAPFTVERFLGSQDYRFIYLGTYWGPTSRHPSAEINYVYDKLGSEFLDLLSRSTALLALEDLGTEAPYDWRRNRWNQTRYEWDRLNHATTLEGRKFVHAHFALPHDPFVFHSDGSFVTEGEAANRSWAQNYVDQVGYANVETLAFVDSLLSLPVDQQPILVIQADEGPWPQRYRQNERQFDWTNATEAELREKFGILSAFYLPGLDAENVGLYPSITPVNQFRVLFNEYFGLDLPILPDRNYIFPNQGNLYEFIDVTDRLRGAN
ncbi:MAG: hypothetical protein OEW24_05700 [Chloroflexota bacterium]|nr:hypothetical protein [Chloroflexota bacterium]